MNHITRNDQQAEEIIKQKIVKFNKSAIKQVDILMSKAVQEEIGTAADAGTYYYDEDDYMTRDERDNEIEQRKKEAIKYIAEFIEWVKKEGYKINIVKDFRNPVR